jgi:hypothetical protein
MSSQLDDYFITKVSWRNYITKRESNQSTLRTANLISQFIYAQLAPFTIHEFTESASIFCLGHTQLFPYANQRVGPRAHRSRVHRPLYGFINMGNEIKRDRALPTGKVMSKHEGASLIDTCGTAKLLQIITTFQVNVQQGYQPAGYLRVLIRIVMEPKWDDTPRYPGLIG